ncbi:MAG: bacterial regulatory s, tetR family protein [Pseudomonas sp.]|nr:bacterial regulatory s, tetR family protein [Pseudomonas sp.]
MAGVRQFDEEQTLDRVLEVFWQKGLGATSMQDLAQATGVQRGSLYNAFQSKEELFLRVFDRYKKGHLGEMRAALAHPVLETALRDFFYYSIGSMTIGSPTRGCLSTKTALGEQMEIDVVRNTLQALLNEMEQLLFERLDTDEARPKLTLPPADAARLVVTFTRGIVVVERVFQDVERLHQMAGLMMQVLLVPKQG